nr:TPA_asm: hypothetical protein HUJ06_013134 [Nelumbo nucifera]
MSSARIDPSELHLKKELTALRKAARFLRDPETCSSWRSPLSSRSVAAASSWTHGNGIRGNSSGANHAGGCSELDSQLPLRSENNRKKVFLYNWRSHSVKSNDSGAKLDGDKYGMEGSVPRSPEDSSSDANKEDSKSDTYIEDPVMVFRARGASLETPLRRTTRKSKKISAAPRQHIIKNPTNSKSLEYPLVSLRGTNNSVEQSDDTETCNSEDLRILTHNLTQKVGYTSRSVTPLLPRNGNWSHSSKLFRSIQREDSSYSYTPASTSSYNKYGNQNPSTVESWDGTTASFNGDELDHLELSRRQGCGIPCYWSKRTPKHRGCGSCYSPSLSDTLRRKGSSILCGSQTLYHKRRSARSNKRKLVSRSAQGVPLLTNGCDGRRGSEGSSVDTGQSDDELSTNFGELDLEALSRLDGRRWSSSCRSQEGLELVALTGGAEEGTPDHVRSLSQKYRPRFFDELIGQNIVVQSLVNAVSRGRIAPFYLFQGPRGTGKTTTARIFTAALNCLATQETKPCGFCGECTDFFSGKNMDLKEVDATNRKGIERIRHLLKNLSGRPLSSSSRYRVFIIDECHLLPSKTWSAFLKFLEETPPCVVFVFITTDIDGVPRTVLSRCQKYLFNKIKDTDIVTRLKKISVDENLDVESEALHLIALNADGSLRDAETMLDQLSLLGKRITTSLVNELVGVVSDEKLLDLLELAMSSDTAETVKRARELMDSGVDPMALMSQLAGLIMDIIAGTYHVVNSKSSGSFFGGRNLTEAELERLKQALKLLSEAEKQLRVSSERSTWFTAALLQLGAVSTDPTYTSSRRQSSKTTEEDPSDTSKEASADKKKTDALHVSRKSTSASTMPKAVNETYSPCGDPSLIVDGSSFDSRSTHKPFLEHGGSDALQEDVKTGNRVFRCTSPDKLDDIWERCIDRCHSKTLRQLLREHGKLISISDVEGVLIVLVAFCDGNIKSRAERFLSSITNSIEVVLRHNVEVRIELMPDVGTSTDRLQELGLTDSLGQKQMQVSEAMEKERKADPNSFTNGHTNLDMHQELVKLPRDGFNNSKNKLQSGSLEQSGSPLVDGKFHTTSGLPVFCTEGNDGICLSKERRQDTSMQRIQDFDEQRLESAWVQDAEKGTPRSVSRLKPERNQVLPQDGIYRQGQMTMTPISSEHCEDELNQEIKSLKANDHRGNKKDQSGRKVDHYPISPSLLHDSTFGGNFNKDNLGYESGPGHCGCNGILCWKPTKHFNKGKV